ncbi:hypothetical protein DAEQUDRAFT_262392 [Daedalea quercina L-15889]|uniref:Uncharacterized protein n=1 Tax=Daedalea quercina L-15889 TaxID=1314783 RepID=A0A165QEX7_9APHY|nr:hypothetical protein DAEQUDRAFT_262392 [Daedalea quercina L-15889]
MVLLSFVSLATFLLWTIVSTLRVYTISSRSCIISLAAVVLGLVPFATNLYLMTQLQSIRLWPIAQFNLCSAVYKVDISDNTMARGSAIASDVVVVLATWYFLPCGLRNLHAKSAELSVAGYMWKNGTIQFVILLLFNGAELILDATKLVYRESAPIFENYNPMPTLTLPITSIVIARFILDLRKRAVAVQGAPQSDLLTSAHYDIQPPSSFSMDPYLDHTLDCEGRYRRPCTDTP